MKRRAFITMLGGAAMWPLAARAQQPDSVRRPCEEYNDLKRGIAEYNKIARR